MSQRDLVAELRGSRIAAPAELRAHVRSIAAGAPAPANRFTWRRALVVALPAAAAIAAVLVVTRPDNNQTAVSARVGPGNRARREVTRRASDRAVRIRRQRRDAARTRSPHRAACSSTAPTSRCACRRPTASPTASSERCTSRRRSAATRPPCTRARTGKAAIGRPDAEDPARPRPGGDHSALRARDDHERAGRRAGRAGRPERDRPHDRAAAGAARDAARGRADRRRCRRRSPR